MVVMGSTLRNFMAEWFLHFQGHFLSQYIDEAARNFPDTNKYSETATI